MAAKSKTSTNKPAGKFKVSGGKSSGMHNFEGVGTQKPGVSEVSKSNTSGKFAKGGGSGVDAAGSSRSHSSD